LRCKRFSQSGHRNCETRARDNLYSVHWEKHDPEKHGILPEAIAYLITKHNENNAKGFEKNETND
jgi:hypothetical protein